VTAKKKAQKEGRPGNLRISYKGGATDSVTTRRPMVEIVLFREQIEGFGANELEFQLEAYAKGKVFGEAASCHYLDPSTHFIKIPAGKCPRTAVSI
jgi:hypothetical protein